MRHFKGQSCYRYMLNMRKSNLVSSIIITSLKVYNATLFNLWDFLWSAELFFQNAEILVFFSSFFSFRKIKICKNICQILSSPIGSQKYKRMTKSFFIFTFFKYRQIWLKLLVDDCHFSYVTKLKKRKPWFWACHKGQSLGHDLLGYSYAGVFLAHQT